MDVVDLFVSIAVMVGLSWGSWKLILWIRKQMWGDEDFDDVEGFSLNAIRELHRAGKITAEEYEKLKVVVVAAAKKAADRIAAQIAQRARELEEKKNKRRFPPSPPITPPYK